MTSDAAATSPHVEFGLDTFGDVTVDDAGRMRPHPEVLRDVVAEGVLADLMLAIIGGDPARFAPWADLHRQALAHLGLEPQPVGAHIPGHIAADDQQARDAVWPHYAAMHARIGRERGWAPMTRAQFDHATGPEGALMVGAPDTVAPRIARAIRTLGLARFDLKYSMGTLPHELLCESIRLYATEVVPRVRALLAAG